MHQIRNITLLLVFLFLSFKAGSQENEIPAFIDTLIQKHETEAKSTAPDEIWSYMFKGWNVYYVSPMYCCDIPSTLYDELGGVLCHPDGGFAGVGDGRCPEFNKAKTDGVLIWRDKRRGEEK